MSDETRWPVTIAAGALLLVIPWVASPFWTLQIGAQSLLLGVISLSLMFLAGYGGMVSMAQMTVAGAAGYAVALLGGAAEGHGLHWPFWVAVPLAVLAATVAATLIGAISVRTEGIYTIMITLAIAVALFYLAQQNYDVFNGFDGFKGVTPPAILGIDWRAPGPFYHLCLAVAALAYGAVLYLSRSTFGLGLQAIRDNPRRMSALGFHVTRHRVLAHALAGLIAALGGVLFVWYHGRISPGSIGLTPVINTLVVAVLGGLGHPVGPFLGAALFVLLQNFAIDFIDRERFNTLIGLVFLAAVLFSSDGLLGLGAALRARRGRPVGTWRPVPAPPGGRRTGHRAVGVVCLAGVLATPATLGALSRTTARSGGNAPAPIPASTESSWPGRRGPGEVEGARSGRPAQSAWAPPAQRLRMGGQGPA